MELYQIKQFSFRYPTAKSPALKDIQFSIAENDFLLLFGDSGSGKTTLLRALKKELIPNGEKTGEVLYKGVPIEQIEDTTSAKEIGYTAQNPDVQNVSQYVKHELAFLLRNLSYSEEEIALRVAQTVSFFGTKDLYRRAVSTLSGGEKQLVHLQSLFTSEPNVLLLDEPLAQLDPFSTERFLDALRKIKAETNVAIVIASHEILPLLPLCNSVLHLQAGKGTYYSTLDAFLQAEPKASLLERVLLQLQSGKDTPTPKTIAECQAAIQPYIQDYTFPEKEVQTITQKPILELKNVSFRYEKHADDILSDLNFALYAGEIFTIVGANGAGKSTLLGLLGGYLQQYCGKIKRAKTIKTALVPQNPQAVFAYDTVLEILESAVHAPTLQDIYKSLQQKNPAENKEISAALQKQAEAFGIEHLLLQNPFDLSGGEQQRVALLRAYLQNPDVLLIDEGTKGLDEDRKAALVPLLQEMKTQGKAILLVTHDLDFAATVSDRTALLFDGQLLGTDSAQKFFTQNGTYTSTVAKIFAKVPADRRPITMEEVSYAKA